MPEKKKSRRSRVKHPALKPEYNLKSRYELIDDCDYLHKLDEKTKDWKNAFNEEYYNANFNHPGQVIHQDKSKFPDKDSYDRNNARNRCMLTRAKASGRSIYLEDLTKQEEAIDVFEKMIDNVDNDEDDN